MPVNARSQSSEGVEDHSELDSSRDSPLPEDRPPTAIRRQVVRLALPVLVEQALLYLVGLSDTILTGRYLGEDQLAAVTVASYLLWLVGAMLAVVSVGPTALVARMVGAGRRGDAARVCEQSIGLALLIGTSITIGAMLCAPKIVGMLNLSGEPAEEAVTYLRIILTVTPLLACTAAGNACLRGTGDTRTGMWVMILVNLLNLAFSWILVQGFGPFPEMGLAGVAAGTAIGEGVGGLVILTLLVKGRSGLSIALAGMAPRLAELVRILRISLPAVGESLTNSGCQLWFLALINQLGPVSTAAHGVAIRCESIAFLTVTAFAVASSTLTGQYLGARRPDLAAQAAKTAWGLGVLTLTILGVVVYWLAEPMFGLFLGDNQPLVTAEGVPVLRVVAFALPALATISVLNGALRGAGDTRFPWLIVLIGYFAVRIPLTYLLTTSKADGGWGLGLLGAWYAMFADLSVRGVLVAGRFLQGGWRKCRV